MITGFSEPRYHLVMMVTPYSATHRDVEVESLDDRVFYAFNFAAPSGVHLLSTPAVDRLKELNSGKAFLDVNSTLDQRLHSSGLILAEAVPQQSSDSKRRLSIWLHIVNGCNLSCSYCYVPHLHKSVDRRTLQQHALSYGDSRHICNRLVEFARIYHAEELRIIFAGGEPTLDIDAISAFAEDITQQCYVPVTFGMITNGVFDCRKVIPLALKHSISLSISIDGLKQNHDYYRFYMENKKRQGTWELIWTNIERLQAEGINPYLLFTVTEKNYLDIDSFSSQAHVLKLGYRLSMVRKNRAIDPTVAEKMTHALAEHYETLGQQLSTDLPISRFAKFAEWDLGRIKHLACSSGRSFFAVDQRANVSPCQMAMSRPIGNLRDEAFVDIVEHIKEQPSIAVLTDATRRTGACTACQYFHVCAGGCPQHTLQTRGNLDLPSVWCETYGALVPIYIKAIARQMFRRLITLRGGRA